MKESFVYIQMQLDDILLFTEQHFSDIRTLIVQHKDLTHILTTISFNPYTINKAKFFKNKKNTQLNIYTYIFVDIVAEIDRSCKDVNIMTANVLLQIYKLIKNFVVVH